MMISDILVGFQSVPFLWMDGQNIFNQLLAKQKKIRKILKRRAAPFKLMLLGQLGQNKTIELNFAYDYITTVDQETTNKSYKKHKSVILF